MSTLETVEPAPAAAPAPKFAARIGLDWADQKHYWSMLDSNGKKTRGQLDNTPEATEVWAAELAQRFGGRAVAIALEQSRGAVITVLSKYAHLVLFPVHPTSLANYRKSFSPSGAKCDPIDGDLLLDYLVKHPEQLRTLRPDTVETRSLQFLTEERRKLVDAHTATLQSLIHWLKQVFPQIVRWFDPATPLVANLLLRWPTLQELQKARPGTLRKFFHQHNCRTEELTEERLAQIRLAVPATDDPALLQAGILSIQNAIRILACMRQGITEFDRQIAITYQAHPDHLITDSLPGSGAGAGAQIDCRRGIAAGSLRVGPRHGLLFWRGAGHRKKRQLHLDPLAMGLLQVCPANLPRMGELFDPPLRLGPPILRTPARQGQRPPCRSSISGFQMDSYLFPLLARSRPLQRQTL